MNINYVDLYSNRNETKSYQSVVLCSPELVYGETYVVYSGGSSTGTIKDGLYSGGIHTEGTQITTFTV
jgi:hypothetical protein